MTIFPPCSPARVWITQDEYDRLRLAEQELNALKRGRPQDLGESLRERYESPIPQPVYIQPETVIDCSTGRPWQPGPRKRPAQLAPCGVTPSPRRDSQPTQPQPTQPARPRGWQEPIERIQPIRIMRLVEPAPNPEPDPWAAAIAAAFDRVEGKGVQV